MNTLEQNKLKQTYSTQLKNWKNGAIEFDKSSFQIATLLLKAGLLPENAQKFYAMQIEKASHEALQNKTPLTALFQIESHSAPSAAKPLAENVESLIESGLSKQQAIQKTAITFKVPIFKVSKEYRMVYGEEESS